MSKTIRRKNATYDHRLQWRLTDRVLTVSKHGGQFYKDTPLEGKERIKALSKFHGDRYQRHNITKVYRQIEHSKYRAKSKAELHQFVKLEEHEVQIAKPKWPYWD